MKLVLETTFAVPKIGAGRFKNQLVTTNNVPNWYRWYKKKVKNTFKETLKEWNLNYSNLNAEAGRVEFRLYRPTKHRLDADSIVFEGKWFVDTLVELGYFRDDDQITFVYEPVIVEQSRVETEVGVKVYSI